MNYTIYEKNNCLVTPDSEKHKYAVPSPNKNGSPYNFYKVVNEIDDMVYIGCTKQKLSDRWHGHLKFGSTETKAKYKTQNLHAHMKMLGRSKFKIELIKTVIYSDKTDARITEQIEIDKIPMVLLLNKCRAHTYDREATRNKKKHNAQMRERHNRKKLEPGFIENERKQQLAYYHKRMADPVYATNKKKKIKAYNDMVAEIKRFMRIEY